MRLRTLSRLTGRVDRRVVGLAVLAGVVHAVVLVGVAVRLGYPMGPGSLSAAAALWRYGGLVLAAGLPAYLALRDGLLAPAGLAIGAAAYVVHAELSPPGPTFIPLQGFLVVRDGLYVGDYATRWYAPLAAFLHAGLLEAVVRSDGDGGLRSRVVHLVGQAGRRRVLAWTAVVAAGHGGVAVAYAAGGGTTDPVALVLALPAAVVALLAVRYGLVAPYVVFLVDVLRALHANAGVAGTDLSSVGIGPLLAACLLAAGLEWLLRIGTRRRTAGPTGD